MKKLEVINFLLIFLKIFSNIVLSYPLFMPIEYMVLISDLKLVVLIGVLISLLNIE